MNDDAGEPRRQGTPQGPSVPDELLADFVLGTLERAEAARVAAVVATDPAVARRLAGFRQALDALALDLDPAEPPTAGLDRLLRAAREEAPGGAEGAPRQDAKSTAAAPRTSAHARSPSPARLRAMRRGTRVVAGALVVALVTLVSGFATFQAASVAEVREEQRVLAYWMANPDMTLISLVAPTSTGAPTDAGGAASAGGDAAWDGDDAAWAEGDTAWRGGAAAAGEGDAASDPADAGHLGVVCLLPDGRGLVLRPYPAPRGAWYQVVGSGPEGELELARSGGNVLTFDARGIERLEVRVLDARRSGLAGVLDRVTSLLGGRPAASPDGLGDGLVVARVHLP